MVLCFQPGPNHDSLFGAQHGAVIAAGLNRVC